jgi:hypothetical protein
MEHGTPDQVTEGRRSIVVRLKPVIVVMTGIDFMDYGNHYLAAAEYLARRKAKAWFDPLPYQLLCQALELHLKSYLWLTDRELNRIKIRNKYGHDIEKLWRHAKSRKISRFCRPTPARDAAIEFLGPYYKNRRFAYLDPSMSWEGIPRIKAQPKALVVIARLCGQLRKSLRRPILSAS